MDKLPTYQDICTFQGDLDQEHAAKNFHGKSLQEAEAMFSDNCLHYGEDLFWMGVRGFEYYFRAFHNYLISDTAKDDYMVVQTLATMEGRLDFDGFGSAKPLVIESLKYVIDHYDKFMEDPESFEGPLPNLASLVDDKEVLELLQSTCSDMGLSAEQTADLLGDMDKVGELDLSSPSDEKTYLERLDDLYAKLASEPQKRTGNAP